MVGVIISHKPGKGQVLFLVEIIEAGRSLKPLVHFLGCLPFYFWRNVRDNSTATSRRHLMPLITMSGSDALVFFLFWFLGWFAIGVGLIYLTLKVLRRISEKIDSGRVRETSAGLLEALADKLKGDKR